MFYYCVLLLTAALLCVTSETSSNKLNHDEPGLNKSCPKDAECPDGRPEVNDQQSKHFTQYPNLEGDDISDLAEVPSDPAWWNLFSKAKTELVRATTTLYDTLNSITMTFADIVRKIMNEELYDILATLVMKIMYTPGEALYDLFEAILSTILLLICLISSYVLLKIFHPIFILAFLSTIFLLHYILGPVKIFKGIFLAGEHLFGISWIIATHPYITSAVIVVLIVLAFAYSIVMTIINCLDQRRERRQRMKLYFQVEELSKKVHVLENNQEKMLKILRQLKGDSQSNKTTQTDEN